MGDLRDEIIFRQLRESFFSWSIECSYNEEFVAYLKRRVAAADRSYDQETNIWKFADTDGKTLNALEGIASQKFMHAQRVYWNSDGKLVLRNIKTGVEAVQEKLF